MKALDEGAMISRNRITGKATVIFLAVMLFLTFFSKTINNFTLPKITYERPANGALIKEATGTGNVQAKAVHDLYVRTSMKVTGVMVEVGDPVKQGQALLTLDITDIENQLKDEQDKVAQRKLYLEKLKQAGEKLKEANSPENLLSLDKTVQTAQQNLDKAQRNYDSSKVLYEVGGISASALADAKMNLDSAEMDYEIARNNRDKAARDNSREIENNIRDVESTKLDIAMAERKIAELTKELNMKTVTAPCDGIVTDLYYSAGMTANTAQPLYKIADTGGGFQFVATVNITAAEYLELGDPAEISISALNGRAIQGKVNQIKDNPQQIGVKKDVIIEIPTDGLIGGEVGTANIKKNIGSYNVLVSNSAVGQDGSGYFVYVLKDRKGPLGNEFYVEKVSVSTGDSDNLKTAVLSGISTNDKVVSDSDKPLSDGSRVMLAN
ncbi:HlyD family secretion protein [Geosporobacter ferrireducens]|uniref:HlyD family secretion protein n=1 Tax=Geosporobacter ferrireducens TaxID=1424294 RepID=UPI00139CFE13|nr:efflux RND transporter periplasmic adaptor subunit [Geosporobacter ferrireducens]MTI55868.1 HlyD family efflux transporter periplasmic adaptor subunit [Geosporobacter ferrireducens]